MYALPGPSFAAMSEPSEAAAIQGGVSWLRRNTGISCDGGSAAEQGIGNCANTSPAPQYRPRRNTNPPSSVASRGVFLAEGALGEWLASCTSQPRRPVVTLFELHVQRVR